jgi:Fur family ferric uptake transcriptional regulator
MNKSAEQVFVDFMRREGKNLTDQRKLIAQTFLETKGHFSAEELTAQVKRRMPQIGQATVYRTLKLLVDSGLAETLDTGDGVVLYEQKYGQLHHDHLICTGCGKRVEILDAVIEVRQAEVAARHGYELTQHRMILYGLCEECRSKGERQEPRSLTGRSPGAKPVT